MDRIPSDLIIGYLKKSLGKEETEDFYSWVNENSRNKKLFFEAKAIYDACITENKYTNVNDSWQRLIEKRQHNQTKTHTLWNRWKVYGIVASIAVILTSVSFIFYNNMQEQSVAQYIGGDGINADMIILPDGTRISLGSKTTFHYAKDYGKKNRIVYLEGEAFFDVAKQKNKPFVVKVKDQDIEALGTKFNVMAYRSDSIYTTTLLEGSVSLTMNETADPVILQPDQQIIYNRNTNHVEINSVDASRFTSWVDGYYYFPDQSLEIILARLTNIYGLEFDIRSEKLKNTKFTGTFYRGQTIKNILEVINVSIPIKYKIDEKHVTISE